MCHSRFFHLVFVLLLPNAVVSFHVATRPTSLSSSALLARSGPIACRPIGIGNAVPTQIITNVDLETVVDTTDEWIQSRTGIAQRRVLTGKQGLRDLAILASKRALDMAQISPDDLDLVICCTSTPDDMFGDAPSVAAALGCTTDTVAFDLTAACSGFLFGVVTAGKFLDKPKNKALVIGADALSRWVDWDDRNTCILFGDGAGAMVLEASETPGVLGYAAHSNGNGYFELKLE
jgi:3-oxoacyl-[acyl-carrier-protein] synthase-3